MKEDYEVIPHQLLIELKGEVEALKKKLTRPDQKANELILEIESLKDSIHDLTEIFHKTLEDIKEEGDTLKTLDAVKERLDAVVTQNETIAKGMIAVADKVDNFVQNQPAPAVTGPPPSMPPSFSAPRAGGPMPTSPMDDFPPPPPKRKGLF